MCPGRAHMCGDMRAHGPAGRGCVSWRHRATFVKDSPQHHVHLRSAAGAGRGLHCLLTETLLAEGDRLPLLCSVSPACAGPSQQRGRPGPRLEEGEQGQGGGLKAQRSRQVGVEDSLVFDPRWRTAVLLL